MTRTAGKKLVSAVEAYFTELRGIRASGGGTGERSTYPAVKNLLDAVGGTLEPKVRCVIELADQGAGHPDIGLYSAHQMRAGKSQKGQLPERGVVEVKPPTGDAPATAVGEQVAQYRARYGLVLVTNLREFELVGTDARGSATTLESFRLADSEEAFDSRLKRPRNFANEFGVRLAEYLRRALSHKATLAEAKDLAWLLASYARDGLARVEATGGVHGAQTIRDALEEALGVRFKGEKGSRFFYSTLVQTLFYGIFSAWVLQSRERHRQTEPFDWRTAVWHLRAPVLRALFHQISGPGRLELLNLIEVLDWAAAALDRVDRDRFFASFREGEAVPYFYEPFLAEFDPQLRKQLGVWYTPTEVVKYMVARVDNALKHDLCVPDGLAADNVYVLDPCCGTGAYPAEVLRRIARNLRGQGLGALVGAQVRKAATERVFGFEIMPAPFVVAHLQVGLTMHDLEAPLSDQGAERAQIFLTNALTGWEPSVPRPLPFPELEEERDRAERVKQNTPILVILGNPPYNGFAGLAVDEESELIDAYRRTRRAPPPEGQGLNDLYVRFYRMAERRIVEKTGRGVVCFISNYSWLDRLSFTGMRERFLEAFDIVRIDCLNGDKYKTGKVAPDGSPDPSIFSTPEDPVGIQVGTCIATLVRKIDGGTKRVAFRHLWGQDKGKQLTATAEVDPSVLYESVHPRLRLGLPYLPVMMVSDGWFEWPSLPELLPESFPGVKTSRDLFLVDIDLDRLRARVCDYFDIGLSHQEIARRYPKIMKSTGGFDAHAVRDALLKRGGPDESGFVRFAYRPFDNRWLYWEKDTKLLDRKRADYRRHVFAGNMWVEARQRESREKYSRGTLLHHLGDNFGNGLSTFFPAWLAEDGVLAESRTERPNLSSRGREYLTAAGASESTIFFHVLAVLHDPLYRQRNADALRLGWPRIPIPGWLADPSPEAINLLSESASRGRVLASLLDPDTPVPSVTSGQLAPLYRAIAIPSTADGRNIVEGDLAVTAGWGRWHAEAVMPGKGKAVKRPPTPEERASMGDALSFPIAETWDIYMNDYAYWSNIPDAVWQYRLGGYQVCKKWLSYREYTVLDRRLTPAEVHEFATIARRIAAILQVSGTPLRVSVAMSDEP